MSRPAIDPDWIVPAWPAPTGVKALVTTRPGGVSGGPYESMNLGFATGDARHAVEANRARLRALLPQEPRWLKQVHGARVVDAESVRDTPEADASFTCATNIVCAISIADCLPVFLCDRPGTVVACAHAGWRGLAAGVLENAVATLCKAGTRATDLIAYMGPGIGPKAFEVGADVHAAFVNRDADAAGAFEAHGEGKWLADLPALARRALARCGVTDIHGENLCTYSDARRFFSYRRDGVTGRMAALIWRE